MLGGPFEYLGCCHWMRRKFSRGTSKQVFPRKMEFFQKFRTPFLGMVFEKIEIFVVFHAYNLIHVSYDPNFFTGVKSYARGTF